MTNIKAIYFDIDGTLVEKDDRITESSYQALKLLREKGIKLFISTGRPPFHLRRLTDHLDFVFDGYIVLNGQYCYVGEKVIRDVKLPTENLSKALAFLTEHKKYTMIATLDNIYCNFPKPTITTFPTVYTNQILDQVYQLNTYISINEPEIEKEVIKLLPGCKASRWQREAMDIMNASGSKGIGIDAINAFLGIKKEETMAFGDGENDIEMMEHVGISVAMGNAMECLKEKVDYVTDSIGNDGIYKALIHFGVL